MKLKYSILLLILPLVFACSQQVPDNQLQLINLEESDDILPISSFASKVDYLELKVSEANLSIGEVEAVKIIDDHLVVLNRMSGKSSFWRFTKNGEFVIELVGDKTPKIKNPHDIISYKNGFAVLAENGIHTISLNGKYEQQLVRATPPGTKFFFANGVFYVVNESNLGQPVVVFPGKNNKATAKALPAKVQRMTYAEVEHVGKEAVHFYSVLNDTVFAFENGKNTPRYVLNSDEIPTFAQLCDSISDKNDMETLRYLRENEHVIVRNYLESDQHVFLTYWVGSNSTTAIFNKKDGTVRYFGHGINDIDGGVWDKVLCISDKDELYIPITAGKVGGHKISNKKEKHFAELQSKIAASGNPVIMRCKLR